MRVVIGHANPDFDAYASTIAGTKLFPGAKGIFLGSQNANVRAFHNLHEEFLDFADYREVDPEEIGAIVLVDTRDPDRLPVFAEVARRDGVEVIVYDHHPPQRGDINTAEDRSLDVGATTTILVREIRDRGIGITPLEASVMLLGIHEDTGSLTFPNATALDADAAAWLMENGADLEVLGQYLSRTLDAAQTDLLEQLTSSLQRWDINGEIVAVGVAEAFEYVDSAGVLTHYVVEDLGFRVAFAVVRMPGRVQLVARSRLPQIDVGAVMARFGGGGHPQAASASLGAMPTAEVLSQLRAALEEAIAPPVRAADVMTAPVRHATPSWTMRRAGELMATWGHGGLPVLDRGKLVGLVTRKDVDKATRHGLAHAPVTGFMNHDLVIVSPTTVLSELEMLLGARGIGRLPVVEEGKLLGIVTRKDVLRAEHGDAYLAGRVAGAHPEATARFKAGVQALLPGEVSSALRLLGEHAASRGHRAFVVGGFVRDMILGVENLDVDVVIEGDGVAFAQELAAEIGARIKIHRRFGTAVIGVSERFHIDVASARTEYYTRPGALPVVERSSLRQDLFRRDFSINAMAASLEPTMFGVVSDPFAGLRDLDDRVVRVLHGLSYVDDPTRVLRAARFESRYGFRMDEGTERLARQAISSGMLGEVSGARLREELVDILGEKEPTVVLARLAELGALPTLLPEGARLEGAVRGVEDVRCAFEAIATRIGGVAPTLTRSLFCGLCIGVPERSVLMWVRHLHANKSLADRAVQLAERGPSVLRMLEQPKAVRDSRLYRALEPLHAETVVVLWALASGQGRARMERYFDELAGVRSAVNGADLIAMGATPSDAFSAILARTLDDRLDGRAVGRKAELANLRRLAVRAGVLTNREDRV